MTKLFAEQDREAYKAELELIAAHNLHIGISEFLPALHRGKTYGYMEYIDATNYTILSGKFAEQMDELLIKKDELDEIKLEISAYLRKGFSWATCVADLMAYFPKEVFNALVIKNWATSKIHYIPTSDDIKALNESKGADLFRRVLIEKTLMAT